MTEFSRQEGRRALARNIDAHLDAARAIRARLDDDDHAIAAVLSTSSARPVELADATVTLIAALIAGPPGALHPRPTCRPNLSRTV